MVQTRDSFLVEAASDAALSLIPLEMIHRVVKFGSVMAL